MKKLQFEVVWWLITAVILVLVLFPIYKAFPSYPFWYENMLFLITFVTFTRFTFFLPYSWFSHQLMVKAIMALLLIPFGVYISNRMNMVQVFLDEKDPDDWADVVQLAERYALVDYIKTELVFFAIGSFIAIVFLFGRLLMSIWWQYNRGKV